MPSATGSLPERLLIIKPLAFTNAEHEQALGRKVGYT